MSQWENNLNDNLYMFTMSLSFLLLKSMILKKLYQHTWNDRGLQGFVWLHMPMDEGNVFKISTRLNILC